MLECVRLADSPYVVLLYVVLLDGVDSKFCVEDVNQVLVVAIREDCAVDLLRSVSDDVAAGIESDSPEA